MRAWKAEKSYKYSREGGAGWRMEGRKRHRNRNPLLQITTSLRLPFLLQHPTDKLSIYTQSLVHSILTARIRKFATSVAIFLGYQARATGGPTTLSPCQVNLDRFQVKIDQCIDYSLRYNICIHHINAGQRRFHKIIDNSQFGNSSRGICNTD